MLFLVDEDVITKSIVKISGVQPAASLLEYPAIDLFQRFLEKKVPSFYFREHTKFPTKVHYVFCLGNLNLPQCQHQKLNQTESHLNQIDTTRANLEHDEQYANRIYNISGITNPEAPIGELRAYHKKNANTCCF